MDKLQAAIDAWFSGKDATDLTYMASFAPDGFGFEKGANMRASLARAISVATPREPFCWVLPGDDTANMNGFIDARISSEGEFTKPLYAWP